MMNRLGHMVLPVIALGASLSGCGTTAQDAPPPSSARPIVAEGAWVRGVREGRSTEAFLTLTNPDSLADTLRGATTDIADSIALHLTMEHSELVQMATVRALPIPAHDSVMFQPVGTHLMLFGVRRALADGDTIALKLVFGSGRIVEVRAGVRVP